MIWRTRKLKLPEDLAIALERALETARLMGAENEQAALEAILGEWEASVPREQGSSPRIVALERAGWRCLVCAKSTSLECHHGIPRAHQGPDTAENLFPLCHTCHGEISFGAWVWRRVLPVLLELKAERWEEVQKNGMASRKNQRARLDAAVKGDEKTTIS